MTHRTRKRIQIGLRALSGLSLLYLLGVAGNSDLGFEPNLGTMCIKCLVALTIFVLSAKLGGLMK